MNVGSKLKGLYVMEEKLKGEISAIETNMRMLNDDIKAKKEQLRNIVREIHSLKNSKELVITEHAYLRYCERVLSIDLEEIRKKIMTDEIKNQIRVLGNGEYPIAPDVYIVVKDGSVLTIKNKTGAIEK